MNEYKKQQLSSKREPPHKLDQKILKDRYDGIGFNLKKRPKKLIRLVPLGIGSNMQAINRVEQDLLRDIRDIDQMLQKRDSHMSYIHGFLFALGSTKQLLKEFYSALQVSPDAVEDGFYLWRLREHNQNYQLVSSKLIHSPRHFPQKLLDKSIENLMQYDAVKHQQSLGKGKNRWDLSVKVRDDLQRGRRIKTEFQQKKLDSRNNSNGNIMDMESLLKPSKKLSDFKQMSDNSKSHSNPLHLNSYLQKRSKQMSLRSQPLVDQTPSLQQLSVMLRKQVQIVSIWLPPSACPQLIGLMSIQIKEKGYNLRYCLIKKYFWYRHALSRRLFDSLLQWSCLQFDSVTQLALVTSRDNFNAIFSAMGWHLASWISEDRIRITYSGL